MASLQMSSSTISMLTMAAIAKGQAALAVAVFTVVTDSTPGMLLKKLRKYFVPQKAKKILSCSKSLKNNYVAQKARKTLRCSKSYENIMSLKKLTRYFFNHMVAQEATKLT